MDNADLSSTKHRNQFSLAGMLGLTVCIAIGLATGLSPPTGKNPATTLGFYVSRMTLHYALLATASAAVCIGLFQEARGIRRQVIEKNGLSAELRFGANMAWLWRLFGAGILLGCMVAQLLVMRGAVILPNTPFYFEGDIFTSHLWWLILITVLTSLVARHPHAHPARPGNWLTNAAIWGGVAFIGLWLLCGQWFVIFLVHAHCQGVDATLIHTGNRYQLLTSTDEARFAARGIAAAVALVAGGLLMIAAVRAARRGQLAGTATFLAGVGCVCYAGRYCRWYYAEGLPTASPDLASSGFVGSWWLSLGGLLLGAFAITAGAMRAVRITTTDEELRIAPISSSFRHSQAIPLCLVAAACTWLFQTLRYMFSGPYSSGINDIVFLLVDPNFYFMAAIAVLSAQLFLHSRRQSVTELPIRIAPLSRSRFFVAWMALATTAVVGLPTLAAATFSYWLGPWYR